MALTSNQKIKINNFITELEKVGGELVRYKVFKVVDDQFGSKYWNTLNTPGSTAEISQKLIQEERDRYISQNIDMIDPGTVHDIINGVMWPSISENDTAMVDHPTDSKLTSMRGVTMRVAFTDDRLNEPLWKLAFDSKAGESHATFGAYQKAYNEMIEALRDRVLGVSTDLAEAEQKEVLSLTFSSEVAAKCWWIGIYGNQDQLGKPIATIANLNAYLGYFAMMIGWLQGTGALASRGITGVINKELTTFPNVNPGPIAFNTTSNSPDVRSVIATVKAIEQNYKWLQAQKTNNNNKQYYQGWFDRFFNVKKSIVNMLVIINERVHLNINKEFTYSPKASIRLTTMGAAYATKFELQIGD